MYVALEGIDGSGTTSVSKRVLERLNERIQVVDEKAIWVHEPSDRPIGKLMRQCLAGEVKAHIKAMVHLFVGDRIDHAESVVRPALERGVDVISDRSFLSTLAYQQRHHSIPYLMNLHEGLLKPDLILVLNVSVEEAFKRRSDRDVIELYDKHSTQYRVAKAYTDLTAGTPPSIMGVRVIHIDASLPFADVVDSCFAAIQNFDAWEKERANGS